MCALHRITSFSIPSKTSLSKNAFSLILTSGSVIDFSYPPNPEKSAIVNAANEGCLDGGGVDGAISDAGGENLYEDRYSLPILNVMTNDDEEEEDDYDVRCRTGEAVITGPNNEYGSLHVPYVIHSVGPCYYNFDDDMSTGDKLLKSAYKSSLFRAKEEKLEAVAFSLISSGVFRGKRSQKDVLRIGMEAIRDFGGYEELKCVHMCAFAKKESGLLKEVAADLGLEEEEERFFI